MIDAAQSRPPVPPPPPTGATLASPWANYDHWNTIVWSELLGMDEFIDTPVTRTEAMTVPSFARARNVLCTTGGRLPLDVYQGGALASGTWSVTQPEPGRPRFVTMLWTIDQMLCHGRAWWVVTDRYAEDHRPRSFEWVPEWAGVFDNAGNLTGDNTGRAFAPEDVVRIDGPNEGVLTYAGLAIRTSLLMNRSVRRIAENPVPAIELHQTTPDAIDPTEVDTMLSQWDKARRKRATAYTPSSIDARVHGVNPEQLLIDARRAADLEIARAVGVPAWVLDIGIEGSSITYSNVASRSREIVDYGLMPYLAAIEERLSMDDILARGIYCRFNLDELLRGDFGDRMTAYKTAIDAGIYTADELRARENGTPIEETP